MTSDVGISAGRGRATSVGNGQAQPWHPHSSTDSYLSGDAGVSIATAPYPDPASSTGMLYSSSLDSRMPPPLERAQSASSLTSGLSKHSLSPVGGISNDSTSVISLHGHHSSQADRSSSPSYFSSVPNLPSPGQPTITFTSAPTEPGLVAPSSQSFHTASSSEGHSPASPNPIMGYASTFMSGNNGGPSSPRSPPIAPPLDTSSLPNNTTPPETSSRSTSSSGFFSSFRPSSPKVSSYFREDGTSDRRKDRGSEREPSHLRERTSGSSSGGPSSDHRMRRPSSVFEHVGNVWERFGRKVNHSRNATADHSSTSGSTSKRTSLLGGNLLDSSDRSDGQKSPSDSTRSGSQPSPQDTDWKAASSSSSDQRLPAWLEEPAANGQSSPQPPSAGAPPVVTDRSMTPSASSSSMYMWGGAGSGPSDRQGLPASSAPDSPSHEPIEYLGEASGTDIGYRGVQRNLSAGSGSIESGHSSSMAHSRRLSLLERVLIQVTEDNERFAVVDVSGVDSADAIKERMFAKLHMFDEDFTNFQLFRTEIGQADTTGPVVNDDALLALCLQMGDDRGTLKFLVQQTSPPTKPTSRAVPPPTSATSPRRAMRDLPSSAPAGHLRSGSQSSKSSLSDALIYPEVMTSDNGVESSNRHSGSSLQRARAQARRALPSAPTAEELRSPVQSHASSSGMDRRSVASSADGSGLDRPPRPDRAEIRRAAASEMAPSRFSPVGDSGPVGPRPFSPPLADANHRRSAGTPGSSNSRPGTWDSGPAGQHQEPSAPPLLSPASQGSFFSGSKSPQDHTHNLPRSLQPAVRRPESGHENSYQQRDHSNGGAHARLRSEGPGETASSKATASQQIMIHSAKSMDDLRKRQPPPPPPVPSPMHLPISAGLDRDGRYPDMSIARPATANPSSQSQRQLSSDGYPGRIPQQQVVHGDPRMLQRNRSAQAALAGGNQTATAPLRVATNPPLMGDRVVRSPGMGMPHNGAQMMDPRYGRPALMDDPRFHRGPQQQQSHPMAHFGHPGMRQASAGPFPGYGSQANSYGPASLSYDPHRPPMMAGGPVNEFGARGPAPQYNQFRPHDPRLMGAMQGPYPQRPQTYHDAQHYPGSRPPMATSPQFRAREDPFTSLYFPASSSRQVSQFQMTAGRLEPGMTVQETMSPRQPAPAAHGHAAPPGPGSGYVQRDLRRPATANDLQHHSAQQRWNNPSGPLSPTVAAAQAFQNPHDVRQNLSPVQGVSQPAQNSSHRPQARPTTAQAHVGSTDPRDTGNARAGASERSSGSSFSSSSSHRGEDAHERSSIEDSFSAPTSARSSHSGPTLPDASSKDDSDEPRRSTYSNSGETTQLKTEDDDLANMRPLPRPPQQSKQGDGQDAERSRPPRVDVDVHGTPKASEEDGTLKATQWASLWNVLSSNEGQAGTVTSNSSGDADTLRADRSDSFAPSMSSETTVVPEKSPRHVEADSYFAPEENGTVASFASFASFDDDESESGTWAQPLDSAPSGLQLPLKVDEAQEDTNRTLQPGAVSLVDPGVSPKSGPALRPSDATASPRRPELRLTIEPPSTGPSQLSTPARRGSPLPSSSHLTSQLSSGGITRSNSFAKRDNDWAFRPPPEQLYENLDDFFPKHDLDKPVLDTSGMPGSPLVSSPRSEVSPVQPLPSGPGAAFAQRSRHKKSIRIVAQDRKRFLDRAEKRSQAQDSITGPLARRRSTRLWGTKVVEMTPGQETSAPTSAATLESPSSDGAQKPVFKWVKGDLIGKGTYGRVYLALNATTGEMIAVKQVELPRTASDREDSRQKGVVAALKSEIETLKDLDHPHIVSYLGFEETTSFLSIFLEYVPGGSVGSCLRKHGKFEEPTIKSFLHQILEGLAYLHSKGILHRDLKADNILVDFEGICKISDFGTVRRSDDIYGNVENMSLQGSIFWMAPEVVSLSKKGYSAKVDIWSLGCVVLEMFAGRRPWSDDEAVQAMFKIGAERRAPPIPADVMLSKKAAHFLKNCFEIDPAKRPTAARLLDHRFSIPEEGWEFQQSALWRSLKK